MLKSERKKRRKVDERKPNIFDIVDDEAIVRSAED